MSTTNEPGRYLAFSLAGERYAIPLSSVREVIALTPVTPVPHAHPAVRGIMNLRGQIVSVVDLRARLRMPRAEATPESAIVILDTGAPTGVIVDSVDFVLACGAGQVSPPPEVAAGPAGALVTGVTRKDERLVLLLDLAGALKDLESTARVA